MKFLELWLLMIIVLILPACASAGAENSLVGTRWTLVSLGTPGAETPLVEDSAVTLEFKTDAQAGGSSGCNSYGGQYQVQGDTLSFNQLETTAMACADERLMQQEQQYFQALQSAGRFELTDDRLAIWYEAGQAVLNFVK